MHDLSPLKIVLIVEDDYLIALDLAAALGRCGCQNVEMTGTVCDSCRLAVKCKNAADWFGFGIKS